jgi:YVTN family beta-propeller protein
MRLSAGLSLIAGVLLPACGLNQQGVAPNPNTLDFPSSALVDPSGRWLFVVNANSDLRYNNGTLVAIDVSTAATDRNLGDVSGFPACSKIDYTNPISGDPRLCCWDQLDRTILNCDERRYIASASTVRMGSFGAGIVYEPACDPNSTCDTDCDPVALAGSGRLLIGVRGNSSLTWIDTTSTADTMPALNCLTGGPEVPFSECDADHQIEQKIEQIPGTTPPPVLVPDEPYALAMDPQLKLLYVGHLKGDTTHPDSGGVSLFDIGKPYANNPQFLGPFPSIFPPDASGFFGVTSLSVPLLSALGNPHELFVSSRFISRVGSMVPTAGSPLCATDATGALLVLVPGPHVFDTTLSGTEDRGIQFFPDLNRAFVLQRNPPALVGFDLTRDPLTGVLHPTDLIETCANPTFLQAHNPGHAGWRLYVTCFEDGQVYVVDPAVPRVVQTIGVGRGPAGLAFGPGPAELDGYSPNSPPATNNFDFTTRGYVVGFGDNDISVVELDPNNAAQNHVIQRIGFPNTVPR